MWPYAESSGIHRGHFCNNRKWQEAFDMVRSGADIGALVAADPTCETAHLWGLGLEMGAGAMGASQFVFMSIFTIRSVNYERRALQPQW